MRNTVRKLESRINLTHMAAMQGQSNGTQIRLKIILRNGKQKVEIEVVILVYMSSQRQPAVFWFTIHRTFQAGLLGVSTVAVSNGPVSLVCGYELP